MNLVFSTKNTNKKPSYILTKINEKDEKEVTIEERNFQPLLQRDFIPKEIIQPLATDLRFNMLGRVQYDKKKCGSCGGK